MRSVSVRLGDLKNVMLPIGFMGENLHTQVQIDCKKAFDEYPNASVTLAVTPPVGESYPGLVTRDGDMVIWDVTDSDLIADGDGEIQLTFTESQKVKKSYNGRTRVYRSIMPTGNVPTGVENWLIVAGNALNRIVEAEVNQPVIINGNWCIWNMETGAYQDTGIQAQGVGISSIEKTGTSGLIDTYTITYTNGNSTTYTVTNGRDGQAVNVIDDTSTAADKAWSASKVSGEFTDVKNAIYLLSDDVSGIKNGVAGETSVNKLNPATIENGKQLKENGTLSDNANYNCSGFIEVTSGRAYLAITGYGSSDPTIRNIKDAYRAVFYNENKQFLTVGTKNNNKTITVPTAGNPAYVRFSMGVSTGDWARDLMAEFVDNAEDISATFMPYGETPYTMGIDDLNDYVNESKCEINLVAVNCGAFNHVEEGDTTTDEQFKTNWRNTFNGTKADLFALSDCPGTFGQLADPTPAVLFGDTIKRFLNNNTFSPGLALATRINAEFIESIDVGGESAWRKTVYKFKVTLGNKDIYIYVGHYQPEAGSAYVAIRATQYANVIADAQSNGYKYVIFCGDFNAQAISEYAPFATAGYKMCNGGYTGSHNTLRDITADNIIYSANMVEKHFDVLTGLQLNTDHCPIVATLSILPE